MSDGLSHAITILKYHNEWRRGEHELAMHSPRSLGIAIDKVLEAAQKQLETTDEH